MASEQPVQDASHGEDVCLLIIRLMSENLWSHEAVGATLACQTVLNMAAGGDPKVGEFDDADLPSQVLLVYRIRIRSTAKKITWLQISVNDATRMQVAHAVEHLLENLNRFFFRDHGCTELVLIGLQQPPQIPSPAELRHKEQVLVILEDFEQTQNVRMVCDLVNADLVPKHGLILDLVLAHCFQCYELSSALVPGPVDCRSCSRT
mmetsp:Transcript_24589/g.57903  ORF Transcript_24589/g.57903 Transcript_24589/m.57903 type:complete len:206 (-) Transcript_24589:405-1022(-)